MNKKKIKLQTCFVCALLLASFVVKSYAAVVSDNDSSAFITKSEFMAYKKAIKADIDSYNAEYKKRVENTIDEYLSKLKDDYIKFDNEFVYISDPDISEGKFLENDVKNLLISNDRYILLNTKDELVRLKKQAVKSNNTDNIATYEGIVNYAKDGVYYDRLISIVVDYEKGTWEKKVFKYFTVKAHNNTDYDGDALAVYDSNGKDESQWFSEHPIGEVVFLANSVVAPKGYLLCNGAMYSMDDYPKLYAVIGNTFNDNSTPANMFNVPNAIGKYVEYASEPSKGGGSDEYTLDVTNIPSHTHSFTVKSVTVEAAGKHTHSAAIGGDFKTNSTDSTNRLGSSGGDNNARTTIDGAHKHIVTPNGSLENSGGKNDGTTKSWSSRIPYVNLVPYIRCK